MTWPADQYVEGEEHGVYVDKLALSLITGNG